MTPGAIMLVLAMAASGQLVNINLKFPDLLACEKGKDKVMGIMKTVHTDKIVWVATACVLPQEVSEAESM